MNTGELRNYELIAVLNSKNAETLTKSKTDLKENLKKRNVEIVEEKDWGLKKLFHLSQKEAEGSFQYIKFKSLPETVSQLNSDLRVNQSVLKSMIKKLA